MVKHISFWEGSCKRRENKEKSAEHPCLHWHDVLHAQPFHVMGLKLCTRLVQDGTRPCLLPQYGIIGDSFHLDNCLFLDTHRDSLMIHYTGSHWPHLTPLGQALSLDLNVVPIVIPTSLCGNEISEENAFGWLTVRKADISIIDAVLKIPSWHSRSKETEITLLNENSDFNIWELLQRWQFERRCFVLFWFNLIHFGF